MISTKYALFEHNYFRLGSNNKIAKQKFSFSFYHQKQTVKFGMKVECKHPHA